MKLVYYLLMFINSQKIIKNMNLPSCRNCVHFKPNLHSDFVSPLSKCEQFGEKDIITDKIKYDYADICRSDQYKCGEQGKYFQEEKNINLKILKHKMINNSPIILFISTVCYQIIK